MSPEQVRGDHQQLDARSDIYSLGATIYQAFSGVVPFASATRESLLRRSCSRIPCRFRRRNGRLPPELEVIVATAMEKDISRRYASAFELAEDLRRLRLRQPIMAKPMGTWLRVRRFAQRNPAS